MEIADITALLGTLLGVLTPLVGTGIWRYRRQNKRLKDAEMKLAEVNVDKANVEAKLEDWHLWKEQLEAEREHVKFQDERIADLLKENDDKDDRHRQDIKDWEERFTKQTEYLRGVQRELTQSREEHLKLTQENAELRIELEKKRCDDLPCPWRKPPNAHTPPKNKIKKEEYFKNRKKDEA